MQKKKHLIFLGLGTNKGHKHQNIERAIEELSLVFGNPISTAPFMETKPWGYESPNDFLNTVVAFETSMSPLDSLEATEKIERRMGRTTKSDKNGYCDRIIDIDILFYDNLTLKTERLTIPHPLLHKREFVLQPLCAIAPKLVHPIFNKDIETLTKEVF